MATFGGATWGSFVWGSGVGTGGGFTGPLVSSIIYQAQRIAGVLHMPGFTGSPEDMNDGLLRLNAIIDQWAARKAYAYSETFQQFTLTPNHNPYLIGPAVTAPPDFKVTARPIRLEENGATLILTNVTPNVDVPLTVRTGDWWNNQRVKTLTTNVPTDVYYEPDFPNGTLFFWPVPNFAYGIRLRLWTFVTQFSSTAAQLIAPPAYLEALIKTLAEQLVLMYGTIMPPSLPTEAVRARAALMGNNSKSPNIPSADYGTTGGRSTSDWNYYSGGPAR
jgi:hypothetical protein